MRNKRLLILTIWLVSNIAVLSDLQAATNEPKTSIDQPTNTHWEITSAPNLPTATMLTLNCTAGCLSTAIPNEDKQTIESLTLTGTIDARDFKTMRDDMPALKQIDLSGVTIAAYSGLNGTGGGYNNMDYAKNKIPQNAFYNKGITSFIFPSSVKVVGEYAFKGCSSLTGSLNLPNTINHIAYYAFSGCSGLTGTLTIPSSVTHLCEGAFQGCTGFTGNLIIPESIKYIEEHTFEFCEGFNGTLTLPSSIISIGGYAFADCLNLKGDLTIPESVKTIGEAAFGECISFENLFIPEFVTTISKSAFNNCKGLKSIHSYLNIPVDLSSTATPYVFNLIDKNTCILYVPYGTYDLYRNAAQWRDFFNIVAESSGFRLSPTAVSLGYAVNSSAAVNVVANVAWTATSDQSWLNVGQTTTDPINGTITLTTLSENIWKPRMANVTVSSPGFANKTITATQQSLYYKGEPPVVPLSPNMDSSTPIVDLDEVTVSSAYNTTLYFRFKPKVSASFTITSESETIDPVGTLFNNSGQKIVDADDNFYYNGNDRNFSLTYNLTAGQVYYFGIKSKTAGNTPIPLKITGGDLETFTWRNNDNSGKWSPTANWSWGNTAGLLPKIWNGATIDGALSLDEEATIMRMTILPTSTVSIAAGKLLYSYNIITNRGAITNYGTIFVDKAVMNYGNIVNNGTILGPVFAPIEFEENGAVKVTTIWPQWGSTISLPVTTREGYDFVGWYDDPNLTTACTKTIMPINGFKVYAKCIALPKATTEPVTALTSTSVTGNGTITFLGAPTPTHHGFVWSTTPNPVIVHSSEIDLGPAAATETFSYNITGLKENTTYYLRAYVVNPIGVGYGKEVEFTTKAVPSITWDNPADITYDTPLSSTQLNATANYQGTVVKGSFNYTPTFEEILNAGNGQTLRVEFEPDNKERYETASKEVFINVLKATPVISWNNPDNIVYETLLGDNQLNATVGFNNHQVNGALKYSPDFGEMLNAGENTLSVSFTPSDAKNYNTPPNKTVKVVVDKATPVVTWDNPANIVYETLLGDNQLNATVGFNNHQVNGALKYSPDFGEMLNAGENTLSVSFTPSDPNNYNTPPSKTVKVVVDKATPVVTWNNPANIVYETLLGDNQLNATVGFNNHQVNGALKYSPDFGEMLNAGENTLSVAFTPTDQNNYNSVTQNAKIVVEKATPVITWNNPANIVYETLLSSTQLNAAASFNNATVRGEFKYSPDFGDRLNAGENTLSVVFTPTDLSNYNIPSAQTAKIVVDKATPIVTWSNPANITYGTTLGNSQLAASASVNGSLIYTPNEGTRLNAGQRQSLKVDFTPTDGANYYPTSKTVQINVNKAKLSIGTPNVVKAKLYDGNTSANINSIGQLSGVIPSDQGNVTVDALANYADAEIGSNKTIKVAYSITGSASDNYITPDDYIISDASISELIALKTLQAPQAGCEGGKLKLSYTTESGAPAEYQLFFDTKALSAGFKNTNYASLPSDMVLIDVPAHLADGTYSGSIQMRDEHGIESVLFPFQFAIDLSTDIIIPKFGNVVLVDNHTNRFTGYQWFKDGTTINGATKQFYKDPNGLSGSYHVQVTTTLGETLNTCPKVLNITKADQVGLNVYPNPLRAGQECSIKLTGISNEELNGAILTVYNMQGRPVFTSRKVEVTNRIILSEVDGVYMGRITVPGGENLSFKIIMTND